MPATETSKVVELPRHGRNTACCGAGGGRMWFDDGPDTRIGTSRVKEMLESGAQEVIVACPFCLTMIGDGLAAQDGGIQAKDIAELLVEALDKND
ncbi:MAG: (Fe-S)-binding protein, partial [Planctomycetes bacterium]|nr:(Fe-S)-binding protein [Planctomycetota bacterium]